MYNLVDLNAEMPVQLWVIGAYLLQPVSRQLIKWAIVWPKICLSSHRQKGSQKSLPFSAFIILTQSHTKAEVCRTLYIDS